MGNDMTFEPVRDIEMNIAPEADILLVCDRPDDLVLEDSFAGSSDYVPYGGPYEIDPVFHSDTTLATRNKLLTRNLTVRQIKITESTNPSGGRTVLIG